MRTEVNEAAIRYLMKYDYALDDVSLLHCSSNVCIISSQNKKYVVRIFKKLPNANTASMLQSYLHKEGLPVPRVLLNNFGHLVTQNLGTIMMMYEFCPGEAIGWGDNARIITDALTNDIAEVVSNMHTLMLSRSAPKVRTNSSMDDNGFRLKEVGSSFENVRKTIIHGDLTRENILVSDARDSVSAIIDFGDAQYDYITCDIAVLLTQLYVTKTWGIDVSGIKTFMLAYVKNNSLNADERRTILPLMRRKNTNLILEIDAHRQKSKKNDPTLVSIKASATAKLKMIDAQQALLQSIFVDS